MRSSAPSLPVRRKRCSSAGVGRQIFQFRSCERNTSFAFSVGANCTGKLLRLCFAMARPPVPAPPFERRWSVRSRRSPPHIICAGAPSPPGMMRSRWTQSASAVSRRGDGGRSVLRPMNLPRWSANRLTRFARACRRTSRIILSVGFAKRCCTFGAVPDRRNLPVSAHHPRLTLC